MLFGLLLMMAAAFGQLLPVQFQGVYERFASHDMTYEHLLLEDPATRMPLNYSPVSVTTLFRFGLHNGDRIRIIGEMATGRRLLSTIQVQDVEIISKSLAKEFVVDNKTVPLTSVTVIVDLCNITIPVSVSDVNANWFGDKNGTIQKTFAYCSNNMVFFSNASYITRISVPCQGVRPDKSGTSFNFATECRNPNEIDTIRLLAVLELQKQGINVEAYNRFIILTRLKACPWSGLAMTGCAQGVVCTSWIQVTSPTLSISTIFHELLHNTGLYHSNRVAPDGSIIIYGDVTDPMGKGAPIVQGINVLCPNAPQIWKLGWLSPSTTITNLPVATTQIITVPIMGYLKKSMVRIELATPQALFISLRLVSPTFDSGLRASYNRLVYLHLFNGTTNVPRPDPWQTPPVLIGVLNSTPSTLAATSMPVVPLFQYQELVIKLLVVSPISATVSVCKQSSNVEVTLDQCSNNVDDDCNGLIDDADPSCYPVLGYPNVPVNPSPPMPPSPKPPSPKRSPPRPPSPKRSPPRPPSSKPPSPSPPSPPSSPSPKPPAPKRSPPSPHQSSKRSRQPKPPSPPPSI